MNIVMVQIIVLLFGGTKGNEAIYDNEVCPLDK